MHKRSHRSQPQANSVATSGTNCWGEVYTTDAWGNLYNRSGVSGMGTCTTEQLSLTATSQNHLSGLSYDIAGNVLTDGSGAAVTYDAESRVITDAGYTYSYDAQGVRTEKAAGSTGTMYWPGAAGVLAETNLAGSINEEYVFFNGERIARIDRPSGAVHYYFSDHLQSLDVITDSSANVQERCFYYPYGGQLTCTGSDTNHYKFTGKERDSESGDDYFGARYYTSSIGRFLTPDWAARPTAVPYALYGDPQSLNLYTYVRNDPVSQADADGHISEEALCEQGKTCSPTEEQQKSTPPKGQPTNKPPKNQDKAQNKSPVNMSVEVSEKPGIHQNVDLGDGKSRTVVGAQLKITLTDSNGKPLSGSVKESNKEGGTQNPNAIPLSSQGTLKDWVGKSAPSSVSLAHIQEDIDSGITVKSTQTLTITTGGSTYQADWTRTMTNVDARGKVGDLSITWTTPVITQPSQ